MADYTLTTSDGLKPVPDTDLQYADTTISLSLVKESDIELTDDSGSPTTGYYIAITTFEGEAILVPHDILKRMMALVESDVDPDDTW